MMLAGLREAAFPLDGLARTALLFPGKRDELPANHVFRPTLLDAVTRGLNQAAEETLAQGFTGTWTDNFARGLSWIGENKSWRDALNVNLNASGKNGAPAPGFAILPVLESILKQEPKP